MGFFSSIDNAIRSVTSAAFESAKNIAGKAIEWMAEKAENFVDGVKNVWKTVKPHVDAIRTFLQAAARAIPIPWLSAALVLLDKAIGALVASTSPRFSVAPGFRVRG